MNTLDSPDQSLRHPETLRWVGDADGHVLLIEQTRLPAEFIELEVKTTAEMIDAIVRLAVRGAPALGVAGAYGVCLALRGLTDRESIDRALERAAPALRNARPTAVNLATMVDRMLTVFKNHDTSGATEVREALLTEAQKIHQEDKDLCSAIGRAGASIIEDGETVLTHCNAGALATGGSGTALAVLYEAWRQGRRFQVFADETRPLLQGARLTSWELARAGIPVTVIADGAAGHLMSKGEIDRVITGSDRIAGNGDAANKIGTYGAAVIAQRHEIPFYIAAPSTTFDFELSSGSEIPIEERSGQELWQVVSASIDRCEGPLAVPDGVEFRNPAFDVTPADLISGWITEAGLIEPPFTELKSNSSDLLTR